MSSDTYLPSDEKVPTSKKQRRRLLAIETKKNADRKRLANMAEKMFGPKLRRMEECKRASGHGIIPAAAEYVEIRNAMRAAGVVD